MAHSGMLHSGEKVLSRDEKLTGQTTGSTHRCQMEGCLGLRISVKWQDGKTTFPCSKGMTKEDHAWKIM